MRMHNPLGERQSETASLDIRSLTGVASEESLKHARKKFRRDSRPGIANGEVCGRLPAAEGNFNRTTRLVVFDRIVRQVEKQLAQAVPVAFDNHFLTSAEVDANVPGKSQNLGISEAVADQFVHMHPLFGERNLAGVSSCQKRQALDDFGQALNFIQLAGVEFTLRGASRRILEGGFHFPA